MSTPDPPGGTPPPPAEGIQERIDAVLAEVRGERQTVWGDLRDGTITEEQADAIDQTLDERADDALLLGEIAQMVAVPVDPKPVDGQDGPPQKHPGSRPPPKATRATPLQMAKKLEPFASCLGYNSRTHLHYVTAPVPWWPGGPSPRPMSDVETLRCQLWLEKEHKLLAGKEPVADAITLLSSANPHEPVRAWLSSLVWDGKPRISTWLRRLVGAHTDPDEYIDAVGRAWLIGAVARAMDPGCQMDYVLVLEGVQGTKKSSAFRELAGDEWFRDNVPNIGGRDATQVLAESWIVELAELAAINKSDQETLKQWVTTRFETYVPKWGRFPVIAKRACVFGATTNDATWMRDATGGRRFWPVRTSKLDLNRLKAERSQIWSEAVAAHRDDEKPMLSPEIEELARSAQSARLIGDPWEERLRMRVLPSPSSTSELLGMLGVEPFRQTNADAKRVATVMQSMGWSRRRSRRMDGNFYRYYSPDEQ